MDEVAVAAITGMIPLIFLPKIPSSTQLMMLCLTAWLLTWPHLKSCRLLVVALLSFSWAAYQGGIQVHQISQLQGTGRQIVATLESVNLGNTRASSQFFKIETSEGKRIFPPVSFRTSWDGAGQTLMAGQRWNLTVNLRPVHSTLNEGGFDAQRWALAQHVPLTATIHTSHLVVKEGNLRQRFIHRVQHLMPQMANTPVLIALAFGDKGLIQSAERQLLQRTGIAHLVAISGLHIGIAALFGWWLARGVQFLMPVRLIDYRFPLIISGLFLLTYAWLSGGNAPAIRSALAVSLWLSLRFFRIRIHPWQAWLWIVALLLLADPMNLLSDSFWLSCFAVASLIFLVSVGTYAQAIPTCVVLGIPPLGAFTTWYDVIVIAIANRDFPRRKPLLIYGKYVGSASGVNGHRTFSPAGSAHAHCTCRLAGKYTGWCLATCRFDIDVDDVGSKTLLRRLDSAWRRVFCTEPSGVARDCYLENVSFEALLLLSAVFECCFCFLVLSGSGRALAR